MSEIAYAINGLATLNQNCLVLDLLEIEKEGYSCKVIPLLKDRTVAQWRSLVAPADKEVFPFLVKEELLFQQRAAGKPPHADSYNLKQIHVGLSQVQAAFKLLAPTQ